jgi:hypothetical protein
VIIVNFRTLVSVLALLLYPMYPLAPIARAKQTDYCLTIVADLNDRERVSVIHLTLENAVVKSVPKFPLGWQLEIQNQIEGNVVISGGAMGAVAQLLAKDLKCLLQIGDIDFDGTPPIKAKGSVYISTGIHERRVFLRKDQIVLEKIGVD